LLVIAAGIASYAVFLRLFGVTGWREAVTAIRRPGKSDLKGDLKGDLHG
jgi:putative peptidoglycan lipid II flippase